MKIQTVEPIEVAAPADELSSPWSSTVILVKVTTSTGAVGWGEAPTTLMTHPVRESVRYWSPNGSNLRARNPSRTFARAFSANSAGSIASEYHPFE